MKVSNEKWTWIEFFFLSKNFPCISWKQITLLYVTQMVCIVKAELLREGIIFLIHSFARAILLLKELKIQETKAT